MYLGPVIFAVTTSKVRVIGPKGLWHPSFPGLNLESLLEDFGDLSEVDQQKYKALHRNQHSPTKSLTKETGSFPKQPFFRIKYIRHENNTLLHNIK